MSRKFYFHFAATKLFFEACYAQRTLLRSHDNGVLLGRFQPV